MQKHNPVKNHHHEIQVISKRLVVSLIVMGCLLLILILRLGFLQIYKHQVYVTLSTKNWLDLQPIEPTRGLIYDRNGVMLAENISVFSLDVAPYQISDLPKTLFELKKIIAISDTEIQQFQKQLKQHRHFDQIPLKLRLTEEEAAQFTENQMRFPGVFIKARLLRHYPFIEKFSHVLGFVGRINAKELNEIDTVNYSASHYMGKTGIEKYYEDELHGQVGYEEVENDASGKSIRILNTIKPKAGKNIYLTIDSGLQLKAEAAMGENRGAVVAIQPETGQVLAMVSKPGFDPNIFVLGINHADYQALQKSPEKPLYNRALQGLYPIASTIKPFLALQGLETEVTDVDSTVFDPGWFKLQNSARLFHDMRRNGHGTVNLTRAITTSCDTYFYDLAMKLGIHRIDAILSQFGFGAQTGIDLHNELPGNVASPEWKRRVKKVAWYPGDTVNSGIGQGFMQTTPLQLAHAISILANRGQRFMPYLLLKEQVPGKTPLLQQPVPLESVTLSNPENWDIVIHAMQMVVTSPEGTAHRFGRHLPYTLAAKTGTAQVYSMKKIRTKADDMKNLPEYLRDHSLFIAFAPADKPKIALAIIVENSRTAVETTRQIFDYYLGNKSNAH